MHRPWLNMFIVGRETSKSDETFVKLLYVSKQLIQGMVGVSSHKNGRISSSQVLVQRLQRYNGSRQ